MAQPVAQPPTNTAPLILDDKGKLTNALVAPWIQWFVSIWGSVRGPANTTPPLTSSAAGIVGQIAFDSNFLYICLGGTPTVWKRIPLNNF